MLHRSFKPAKCKTSLKLATSRIKLMKNKKGVQINQMKTELAQLLESGQDRTARIRVEHVIREEKMVGAYDLIEIYCELIAARLPFIESQKNCPIDLKEAITSVIFTSPRCADIPELLDIRKHFKAKYGKEFISAAVELRPDCGVSRMLIEKLSAVAPDVQTKIKVLSSVAKEHNIKWDPKSFEEKESKPPDDLLNGPSTFEKASQMHTDPPKFQAPNVEAVHGHVQKHEEPFSCSQQNRTSALGTQNFASSDTSGDETSSATSHTDVRPSVSSGRASATARMQVRQSFPLDGNDFSSSRQNWNMEFKDATSAAQAAAESAERASMAARAAAELSSREKITKQSSTESQKSNYRNEGPQTCAASKFPGERHSRDSSHSSFTDKKPNIQNQQIDRNEHDILEKAADIIHRDYHVSAKRSSRSASLRSSKDLVNDNKKADGYSRESSFEGKAVNAEENPFSPDMSVKKESRESKVELLCGQKESFNENFGYLGEEAIGNQSSISSCLSHSSTFSDEFYVTTSDQQKYVNNCVPNLFASVDQGTIYRESTNTSRYIDDAAAADDEAESDDDDGPRFDMGPEYDEGDAKSYFPSPGREAPTHPSEYNHVPAAFDPSDGPDSESEDELEKSRLSGTKEFTSFPHELDLHPTNLESTQFESHDLIGSSTLENGKSGSDGAAQLHSSSDDSNDMKMLPKYDRGTEFDAESPKKIISGKSRFELNDLFDSESSFDNPVDEEKGLQSQQFSRLSFIHEFNDNVQAPESPDTLEDDELLNQSNLESGKELNFGILTGGLRNKGYKHPPYTKSPSGDASSSSKKSVEESSTTNEPTPPRFVRSSFKSRVSIMENKTPNVPNTSSDSNSDDSNEKLPQQYSQKASKVVITKSQFKPPVAFLNHDGSDSEEDLPKQTSTNRVRLGTGFSRRTKASPSSSYSKVQVESEAKTVNTTSDPDRKPGSHSYRDEIQPEPRSHSERFRKEKISMGEGSLESQAVEQPFTPPRKTVESGNTDTEIKPSRRSCSNETPPENRTYAGSFKEEVSRPMPESKISMRKESVKSETVEQPSMPLRY